MKTKDKLKFVSNIDFFIHDVYGFLSDYFLRRKDLSELLEENPSMRHVLINLELLYFDGENNSLDERLRAIIDYIKERRNNVHCYRDINGFIYEDILKDIVLEYAKIKIAKGK